MLVASFEAQPIERSMQRLIRIGCRGWTTLTFSSPTLAAPKPTAAVAQMFDSHDSIVPLQRFLEVVSTGSWSGCQNTCVWSNCFQALQMLQQLSILHQEDENERAQSLAANDGSNESWIWRKSIEAKDDIEAMTLFKMAKVGMDLTWTFWRWSDYILPFEGIWCRRKRTKMRRKTRTLTPPIHRCGGYLQMIFSSSHGRTQKKSCFQAVVTMYHCITQKFPMFFFLWWSFNMPKNQRDLLWGEDKAEAYAMLGLNEDGYLKVWWFLWFFCETVTHWYLWQMRNDFYETFCSKFFCDAGWNNKWWSWCSRI